MPETCKPELVAAQLERILTSRPLESSPSLCRFLRYVVDETLAGRSGSLKEYSQLEELAKQRYVSPFDLATVSLVLGDEKRAVNLLEEAFRQRSAGMIFLRDTKLPKGHNSPQLDSLIRKMHFAG